MGKNTSLGNRLRLSPRVAVLTFLLHLRFAEKKYRRCECFLQKYFALPSRKSISKSSKQGEGEKESEAISCYKKIPLLNHEDRSKSSKQGVSGERIRNRFLL